MGFVDGKILGMTKAERMIEAGLLKRDDGSPYMRRSCNMLSCVYSDSCPAEDVRVMTFIVPNRASCPDNLGVNKCVVYGIYNSLMGKYNIYPRDRLCWFSERISNKFSALSASLGENCTKGVVRKKWHKTREELKSIYRKACGEDL